MTMKTVELSWSFWVENLNTTHPVSLPHGFSLQRRLRSERLVAKKSWSQSDVVTTVLYNAAVRQLKNLALRL